MAFVAREESKNGITLKIILDDGGNTESPLEDDEAVKFVVLHRRYINPTPELATPEAVAEFAEANKAEWEEFPLYLYDHSGTSYRIGVNGNPFVGRLPQGHAEFDSGRVGSVFIKRADVDDPEKAAESIAEVYTAWANGEVYGFTVEDGDGNELDARWGFIETEGADGHVLQEGRDRLDYYAAKADEAQHKAEEATKAYAKEFGVKL